MPVKAAAKERELNLTFEGEIDHHRARELMEEIDRQVDLALPRRIVLDMAGVGFMDSSGIAVVLRCFRRARELNGAVELRRVPAQAMKVLRAAGLTRVMEIHGL